MCESNSHLYGFSNRDVAFIQTCICSISSRAEEGVRRKLEAGLATAEARICATHPILSRADAWRKEKLSIAAQRLRSELRWTPMEDAAAAMQAHKLNQHRYFLLRDLTFLRDREPLLMKVSSFF